MCIGNHGAWELGVRIVGSALNGGVSKKSSFFEAADLTFLIFAEEDGQQVEAIKCKTGDNYCRKD